MIARIALPSPLEAIFLRYTTAILSVQDEINAHAKAKKKVEELDSLQQQLKTRQDQLQREVEAKEAETRKTESEKEAAVSNLTNQLSQMKVALQQQSADAEKLQQDVGSPQAAEGHPGGRAAGDQEGAQRAQAAPHRLREGHQRRAGARGGDTEAEADPGAEARPGGGGQEGQEAAARRRGGALQGQ